VKTLGLLLVMLTPGCGGGVAGPSSPPTVQAAGVWRGALRVTSGSGEPCVGAAFQSAAGVSFDYTLSVQQTGEQLTATSASPATGIICQLTGTAGTSSIVLNLTTCSNASPPRFFNCAGNVFRDARPSALTVTANISGNSLSGSYAETYDVFDSGTTTNLGTATQNAQLALNRP
jgi:hypothetical protein